MLKVDKLKKVDAEYFNAFGKEGVDGVLSSPVYAESPTNAAQPNFDGNKMEEPGDNTPKATDAHSAL